MKKRFLSLLVLVIIVCPALFLFASCGNQPDPENYSIPDSYRLSVDVFNKGAYLKTIDQNDLKDVCQEVFVMNISNSKGESFSYKFVGYKVSSVLEKAEISVTEFLGVRAIAEDGYYIDYTNLSKAYIAIGEVKEDSLVIGEDYPMLIFDKDSQFGNVMLKGLVELEFDANSEAVGVEDSDFDIDEIDIELAIYQGDTLLATITKETLQNITQQTFTMEVISKGGPATYHFAAYKLSSIFRELDIKIANITSLKAVALDDYISTFNSIDAAYLAVGEVVENQMVVSEDCPRLVLDKNATTNNMIARNFATLIINPID